ncbi:MAG: hypothetical protein JWQ72_2821 [Polaromonas sp.]|nr:hypothetical protein [Polaromonas sp.]
MQRYRNLEGHSGVLAYQEAPGALAVKFVNGDIYIYTDWSTGRATVAQMVRLAQAGRGLSTFISRYVRERYARKIEGGN